MTIEKSVSWVKHDNETVIINVDTNKCVILDESGSEIWEAFISLLSLPKTINRMIEKYDEEDSETIKKDVTEMFELLVENKIVSENHDAY